MDFFTVPTRTFGMIYCFFVISHDRRRIVHCNVTTHPTSAWVCQQLRKYFRMTVGRSTLCLIARQTSAMKSWAP
jgi:hypothetical protein